MLAMAAVLACDTYVLLCIVLITERSGRTCEDVELIRVLEQFVC